jgi:acetyl esterase/lipase
MRLLNFILLIIALGLLSACSTSSATSTVAAPSNPTPTTPPGQVASDIGYASSLQEEGESWTLDIYAPSEAGIWPVVVFLHGFGATKEGHIRESQTIAERGAVVYVLDWPTWIEDLAERENGKGFREMSEVVGCGIRFARATAADYSGDSSHVTLIGFSYGGYLGIWTALASNSLDSMWEEFSANNDGPPALVDCERSQNSIIVDAFIGVGGAYFLAEKFEERNPELWEIVSPIAYLGRDPDFPIRLLHGERDTMAQPESSQTFNDILLEAGFDTQLIMYDGIHLVPPELTAEIVQELAGGSQE